MSAVGPHQLDVIRRKSEFWQGNVSFFFVIESCRCVLLSSVLTVDTQLEWEIWIFRAAVGRACVKCVNEIWESDEKLRPEHFSRGERGMGMRLTRIMSRHLAMIFRRLKVNFCRPSWLMISHPFPSSFAFALLIRYPSSMNVTWLNVQGMWNIPNIRNWAFLVRERNFQFKNHANIILKVFNQTGIYGRFT